MSPKPIHLQDLDGREEGNDVFVVGTGTSLTKFDWSLLKDCRTIALNDACRAFEPSYLVYTDSLAEKYKDLPLYGCTIVCPRWDRDRFCQSAPSCAAEVAPFDRTEGFEFSVGNRLFVKRTVAITGIALAIRLRARRIFLLGIDAYRTSHARYFDGRTRSNAKQYKVEETLGERLVEKHHFFWCASMQRLSEESLVRERYSGPWPGPGIYNLNPLSRIEAWQKVQPEEAFAQCSYSG